MCARRVFCVSHTRAGEQAARRVAEQDDWRVTGMLFCSGVNVTEP